MKSYYLDLTTREDVNGALRVALSERRLANSRDRDRSALGHLTTSVASNPLSRGASMDGHDAGLADIWSIQVRCGRRIGEVVKLRLDCVGEHLGRTWLWVDMTKVGKLDYAVQIPRDVYDLIRARQATTIERQRQAGRGRPHPHRSRAKHGREAVRRPGRHPYRAWLVHLQARRRRLRLPVRAQVRPASTS